MKIKTITCHEVYNHGASLQEYALLKYLESLGHEAETIRYKPPYLSNHFKLWIVSSPKWGKNIFLRTLYLGIKLPKKLYNLTRKKNFDLFSKEWIPSTVDRYTSNEELRNNIPEADAYICGSDQIWNSFFQNGKDPAFYLDFVPDEKLKLSYAASFAIDELEEDIKDFVKEKVSRLDFVSVRETSGVKILNDLGIENVQHVLDPVFLLEPKDWSVLTEKRLEEKKYLFIYDFDSNPLIKSLAMRLKKEHSLKIVSVNENIKYADKNYFLEGPKTFLSLVKNAEFVISNSFHAVAFSIIFKKKFVVFNRSDKINTRMRDLLQSIGLEELLLSNEEKVKHFDLEETSFRYKNDSLLSMINTSKNYLNTSLKQ